MRVVLVALLSCTLALLAAPGIGAAEQRPQAPDITGVTLDGKRVALSHFRGRPVFINVWSSW
jgi:hypothetical protein